MTLSTLTAADIQPLSASVVNKIAAGEVIERPASVVKELLENAIDAGATRVDVSVEQGGLALLRVSDNGHGIPPGQLALAVTSHATSKIRSADDLFQIGTLGFRGEALASIAEISRLVLRSRPPGAPAGAELEVVGGQMRDVAPCGCPPGTTLEVHNLFYNTPVRRKFLRSTQTEMGHISEAFTRIALAHHHLHCTLRHNDRVIYDLPATDDRRERVRAFFGPELADDLIAVASEDGEVRLEGYVASPTHSRANARLQYLFLNGRAIRDRSLQHALGEAYRGLLLTGRYPVAFLSIAMPADQVDVNVHPTKLEVRFQESGRLYSQLLGTLRTKFLTTDLTARLETRGESEGAAAHDPERAQAVRRDLVEWAKGALSDVRGGSASAADEAASVFGGDATRPIADRAPGESADRFRPQHAPLELVRLDRAWVGVGATADEEDERTSEGQYITAEAGADAAGAAAPASPASLEIAIPTTVPAMQVHNRYLVTASEDGVIVIDQHALHERVLYEHLRNRVLAGGLESQSLLVPEPVHLSPPEYAAAIEGAAVLAQIGVRVEPFGGDTVLVSSYPAMLGNFRPAEILHELADRLLAGGKQPDRRDLVDDLLHSIACKAAIKAGDRLTAEEVAALVEQRHLAQDTHHCPHGRPTALVFTRDELDRQFKRT